MTVAHTLMVDRVQTGEDFTGKLYYAAHMETDGVLEIAVAGETVWGIVTEEAESGGYATVQTHGIAKAIAGGVFNPGVALASDANGKLVAATTNDFIVGYAREAGAENRIVSVLLAPGQKTN